MSPRYDITHWRDRLDQIRDMLDQLPEQLVTITGYAMDLAGPVGHTVPPLPGGDVLAILGPWAPDATVGDDLPHPRQVITEWAHTIYDAHGQIPPAGLRFATALRYVRDEVPWILESPWADAWRDDIDAVHGRLATLCPAGPVDETHDDTPTVTIITEDQLWDALAQRPEHELTRRDLTHLGIPASTITTWRHRGKISETRPGRYRAGDILEARRTA